MVIFMFVFFFSSRRRHTRCREVSWARRCVQETGRNCLSQQQLLFLHISQQTHQVFQIIICQNNIQAIQNPSNFFCGHFRMSRLKTVVVSDMYTQVSYIYAVSYTHLTLPTILLVQISVVAVSLKKKIHTRMVSGV
eukprot:TRINITY_DN54674_c0_g1_i2.p1 TRINITY_DN54674_c0_g1~~TRINITY_DN54674_c0_g1_i2.p1  ORF type:complete len:136 (+),score=21.83 TRINITY_DN54674_c0_g1_i2:30-437(+)